MSPFDEQFADEIIAREFSKRVLSAPLQTNRVIGASLLHATIARRPDLKAILGQGIVQHASARKFLAAIK